MTQASARAQQYWIDGRRVGWTMWLHLPATDVPTPGPEDVPDIAPVKEPPIDEPPVSDPPAVEEPTPTDAPKFVQGSGAA